MFSNLINRIKKSNNTLINMAPYAICICFLIAFLPNIFGKLGLNLSQIVQIAFRAIGSLVFVIYSLLLWISCGRVKNCKKSIVLFSVVIIFVLIIPFFRFGTLLEFEYLEPYYYKLFHVTFTFGLIDILTYYVTAVFNMFFAFSLFVILKDYYKQAKHYLLPFYLFVSLMLICVFYSLIIERNYYILFLKGKDTLKIASLFPSKNAFGLFLFQAFVVSLYLFSQIRKRHRYLFIPIAVLFFIVTFFNGCKTALFADLLFLLFGLNHLSFTDRHMRKGVSFSILAFSTAFVCAFVLFFAIPSFHQNGILKTLHFRITKGLETDSRIGIYSSYFDHFTLKGFLTGYTYQTRAHIFYWTSETTIFTDVQDMHNSFLQILTTYGVIILILYLSMFVYAFYITQHKTEKNLANSVIFAILISTLMYTFFEDIQIFMSGSANSFLLSLITICCIERTNNEVIEITI